MITDFPQQRRHKTCPLMKERKLSFALSDSASSASAGTGAGSRPGTATGAGPAASGSGSWSGQGTKPGAVPPCMACRERKVRCDWSPSPTRCARCAKMKLDCSGPLSNQAMNSRKRQLDHSASPPHQPPTKLVSLSPRSTSSRLTTQQVSYALSFSLIQMHLSHDLGMRYTVDTENFDNAWKQSRGKVSEMGQAHELLAHCFMLRGAQITSHPSILGPLPHSRIPEFASFSPSAIYDPALDLPALGFARQSAVATFEDEVLDRLESLTLDEPDDLAVLIFAIRVTPWNARRHRITSNALNLARRWLDLPGADRDVSNVSSLARKANFLAMEELHMSAMLGVPSSVRKSDEFLFGQPKQPDYYSLTDDDLSIILDEGVPDKVVNELIDERIFPSLDETSNEVDRALVLDSRQPPFEPVKTAWNVLWAGLAHTDSLTSAMLSRPPSPPTNTANLSYVFRNIYIAEIELVYRAASIHQILRATRHVGPARDAFLRESGTQLRACLRRMADRAVLVQVLEKRPERLFGLFGYLLTTISVVRVALKGDWSCLGVAQAEGLVQAMGLISYSYAEAGTIVGELRAAIARLGTPAFPLISGLPALTSASPLALTPGSAPSLPSPIAASAASVPTPTSAAGTPHSLPSHLSAAAPGYSPFTPAAGFPPLSLPLPVTGLGLVGSGAAYGFVPMVLGTADATHGGEQDKVDLARAMVCGALSELLEEEEGEDDSEGDPVEELEG